jgi:hypothetical protein
MCGGGVSQLLACFASLTQFHGKLVSVGGTIMKTIYAAAAVSVALLAGQALAADTAPLAPGKPAGIKKAQDDPNLPYYLVGGAGAIAVIAVLASDNGSSATTPTQTTTTTGTSS